MKPDPLCRWIRGFAILGVAVALTSCDAHHIEEIHTIPSSVVTVYDTKVALKDYLYPAFDEEILAVCPSDVDVHYNLARGPGGGYVFSLSWTFTGKQAERWSTSVEEILPGGTRRRIQGAEIYEGEELIYRTASELIRGKAYSVELLAHAKVIPGQKPIRGKVVYRSYVVNLRDL